MRKSAGCGRSLLISLLSLALGGLLGFACARLVYILCMILAVIELIGIEYKEFILRDALDYVRDDYDFILLDCPPSLNVLTVNAMTASDTVIVPIQCEYYALEGLSQLIHTINLVKSRLNPKLDIEGIVFTMYDGRTNLSQQKIYQTVIPRNIRLAEAPSYGEPITTYEPKSAGAAAYRNLALEVMGEAAEKTEEQDLNS